MPSGSIALRSSTEGAPRPTGVSPTSPGLVELPVARNDEVEAFVYGVLRQALEAGALDSVEQRIGERIAVANRAPRVTATVAGRRRVQHDLWHALVHNTVFRSVVASA